MNARARGFTLIEILIVALLGAIVMGAVYQTLTVEYRSNRQINAVVATQQTLRTSMQFLQSELREVSSRAGDVTYANADSIRFRAMRKVAFVCGHPSTSQLDVYTLGGQIANGDSVILFASKDPSTIDDDTYYVGYVNSTPSASTGCTTLNTAPWTSMSVQGNRITVAIAGSPPLTDINNGDPVRSFETVTYGLASKNGSWVLGRKSMTDTMVALIGPLAPGGLALSYFDTTNAAIGNVSASLGNIGRIRIQITGRTSGAASPNGGTYSDNLMSDVFLRGN